MFVDASALAAILLGAAEAGDFQRRIVEDEAPVTSPVAVWETVVALMRETGASAKQARETTLALLDAAGVAIAPIGRAELDLAVEAFGQFGKGRHPARLNLGDCFAYAGAKAHGTTLLYKGDDFGLTDI